MIAEIGARTGEPGNGIARAVFRTGLQVSGVGDFLRP
jgi:hypothetical protein